MTGREKPHHQKNPMIAVWQSISMRYMPFADVASGDIPFRQLLRLSLFQVSVGMATVLLTGTLNRVMIVELGVSAWFVALVVSLPLLIAPFRALIGHRSDTYRSLLGWRRVPYIWFGTMMQFGGLAIMPFALLVLQSQMVGPTWAGPVGAGIAFLLVGLGIHITQTAGLALAGDLVPEEKRPRMVALVYVMLLIGMIVSALIFGWLLAEFHPKHLIQVIQGAAVATIILNVIALWKQEARNPSKTAFERKTDRFRDAWAAFRSRGRSTRLLAAVGLGTIGFSMQDVLLEPYGGEVLGLTVSQTTMLTAFLAGGTLVGFLIAARLLTRGMDTHRLAALGMLIGIVAFSAVIFAGPFESPLLFRIGSAMIGFGGGLFAVGTMTAAMDLAAVRVGQDDKGETTKFRGKMDTGLVIGAWGAVQATAAGLGLAIGGALKDAIQSLSDAGILGAAFERPDAGYSVVYHLEIGLLFAGLIAIGPLVQTR
ncbi:MAG: PucC family protein, partial [Pseudomonadota bacterium]